MPDETTGKAMRRKKSYWIKERHNPQLGTYWVASGQMSKSAARAFGNSKYGSNVMHEFATELAYKAKIDELRAAGESVQ